MNLHWENVSAFWYIIIVAGILAIAAQAVFRWRRERTQRARWREGRRRRIAHARTWDWLMRRPRHKRLSDQRRESSTSGS